VGVGVHKFRQYNVILAAELQGSARQRKSLNRPRGAHGFDPTVPYQHGTVANQAKLGQVSPTARLARPAQGEKLAAVGNQQGSHSHGR